MSDILNKIKAALNEGGDEILLDPKLKKNGDEEIHNPNRSSERRRSLPVSPLEERMMSYKGTVGKQLDESAVPSAPKFGAGEVIKLSQPVFVDWGAMFPVDSEGEVLRTADTPTVDGKLQYLVLFYLDKEAHYVPEDFVADNRTSITADASLNDMPPSEEEAKPVDELPPEEAPPESEEAPPAEPETKDANLVPESDQTANP